jgi:amino acid permease
MPNVAVALFVPSALLVAVTVMPLPGEFGAVNFAVVAVTGVTVPLDAAHVTPAPVSFVTVAISVATWPTTNPPTFGAIVTPTVPVGAVGEIVIVAEADFVVSVTDVAAIVTFAGFGAVAGAV